MKKKETREQIQQRIRSILGGADKALGLQPQQAEFEVEGETGGEFPGQVIKDRKGGRFYVPGAGPNAGEKVAIPPGANLSEMQQFLHDTGTTPPAPMQFPDTPGGGRAPPQAQGIAVQGGPQGVPPSGPARQAAMPQTLQPSGPAKTFGQRRQELLSSGMSQADVIKQMANEGMIHPQMAEQMLRRQM